MKNIRNFCIIAHIDHGKSTLADRLLEFTGAVTEREAQNQLLDDMDLERERGITIKSHAIQMDYELNGEQYVLNLIDTPGHVDFSYEVSRSIAACEGALLIVDAAQGIQAQTISNLYLALENDLEIIPVLNKIDLPSADPEVVKDQIIDLIGCADEDIIPASAKTGSGINDILEAIVDRVPAPEGDLEAPLQAMIFDSVYNPFRGIEAYFKIINGSIKKGQQVQYMATGKNYYADEIGALKLKQEPHQTLSAGEVGYIISGIKDAREVKVGDTLTLTENPASEPVQGFEDVKPMVFAGIYPVDTEDYEELRASMEKLQLNDASLTFEPESSAALGFGFRCGFLGMLHLEIIQERLEREYNLDLITTAPTVVFEITNKKNETIFVDNPAKLPPVNDIEELREPIILASILVPQDHVGSVIKLCIEKRGVQKNIRYLGNQVSLDYEMPLAEVVMDFFDRLKSVSRGFASYDYQFLRFQVAPLVRVDILINGERVDALSLIMHKESSLYRGREIVEKMRKLIPRQMFDVAIQAAIGSQIIARSTVKALRKNVTAKCYGGDVTRKRKLLEKQKAGKKRMKQIGSVEIPQEAFLTILSVEDKQGKKR